MKDLSESRILIVDDAKANVDILVEALKADHKLSIALNGEVALQIAERNPPDLVLLDIVMPGLDGYEVCRRLRAAPQTREVPIMFLSALEDVKNKALGFEAGGNDYLVKPFEILEVKARVRSLLKAKAYSDAVKEKIASELRVAREIQLGILPADIAAVTQDSGLEAHALLEPAKEVGGDLYEFLRLPDGSVGVVLGDVSGKGIPAALFMAVTMTLVRTMSRQFSKPEEILSHVSDALAQQNPRNMFVTLLCGVYDPRTGRFTYASAAHPAPVLVREARATPIPMTAAMVAGVMPGLEVTSQSIDLQPGDRLVLYTDGVTEAFNAEGELWGEQRLLEALSHDRAGNAAATVDRILQAVRQHAGAHPQSDDIAIIALRRLP